MARMSVITKSFAPDFELCARLNRSVLHNSPDTVRHQIVVPRSDLKFVPVPSPAHAHLSAARLTSCRARSCACRSLISRST